MKRINEEKDKMYQILEQHKNVVSKAVLYLVFTALMALILVAVLAINLFIAISHDLVMLTVIIVATSNLLVIGSILFVYGYLKANISELSEVDLKAIIKYDAIKFCIILTLIAIIAIIAIGRFAL